MSELNHDIVAWPTKYRKIYETWRADTAWGNLFDRYMKEGFLAGKR